MFLLFVLLQIDTLSPVLHHAPQLPPPPVGGTKQDWIGYAVSVGVTALVGVVTRLIEKRRMRRRWERETNNPDYTKNLK